MRMLPAARAFSPLIGTSLLIAGKAVGIAVSGVAGSR
jgi:hypothetical protein